MADTTFTNGTVITPEWLNDINDFVYDNHKYVLFVEDFGAVGDGVTNDAPAFQAAIDAAEALIPLTPSVTGISVEIRLLNGPYLISNTLTVTTHRIGFIGAFGSGSEVTGDNLIFNVGDYTDTYRIRNVSFRNINFNCSNGANTTACIKLYRTVQTHIEKCVFAGWDRHIDMYRASTPQVHNCYFTAYGRSTNATAAIRMQGTDESLTTGETYTTGGGFHLTDCEFDGDSGGTVTDSGILIHYVDGFYCKQCHWTGFKNTIDVEAKATAENRIITDLYFEGCYFDDPQAVTGSPKNVYIHGTLKESITNAAGTVLSSRLQLFRFINCYFRGGDTELADRGIYVDVDDGDSWWDNADDDLGPFTITGNHFRQQNVSAIQFLGALNSKIEATGVLISNNIFEDQGSANPSGVGICVNVQAENVTVTDNIFLKNLGSSDYIVSVLASKGGNDNTKPSTIVCNNDFSKTTGYTTRALNITRSEVGSNIIQSGNLFAGTGRHVDECYKVTTTDATPTNIWSYVIPENTAVYGEVVVTGSNSTGSRYVIYSWTFDGRRASAGTLSENITAGRTVKDGTTPAPTFTRSSNTLSLDVTGVAATTIDWNAHIVMTMAR